MISKFTKLLLILEIPILIMIILPLMCVIWSYHLVSRPRCVAAILVVVTRSLEDINM